MIVIQIELGSKVIGLNWCVVCGSCVVPAAGSSGAPGVSQNRTHSWQVMPVSLVLWFFWLVDSLVGALATCVVDVASRVLVVTDFVGQDVLLTHPTSTFYMALLFWLPLAGT